MGYQNYKERGRRKRRPAFLVAGVALLLLAAYYANHQSSAPPAKPTAGVAMKAIDRAAKKLVGPQHHFVPLARTALKVRTLINQGHFQQAGRIINGVLGRSRIEGWHFTPFARFIVDVPEPSNAHFQQRLTTWVAQDPHAATPYLVRSLYFFDTAWIARGYGFANHILPHNAARFGKDIAAATADCVTAIDRDPQDPYPRYLALKILKTEGDGQDMRALFQQSIQLFPTYYPLYAVRLGALEPKWGGSLAAMQAFVSRYAGPAAPTSPLKMLYLKLYAEFLGTPAIMCPTTSKIQKLCTTYVLGHLITPALQRHVHTLITTYGPTAPLPFVIKAGGILNNMVYEDSTGAYVGPLLQSFSTALGADDALVTGHNRRHNFMVDKLAAMVWYDQRQFHNAKRLLQRALADLGRTHFPTQSEKNRVRARLYHDLAYVYDYTHHYRKLIIYQRAADILTGTGSSNLECATLFKLGYYEATIKACTRQIDNDGTRQALYWRARAYQVTGHTVKALHDFRRVADSQSRFRAPSALNISVIYGNENRLHSMLRVLNRYSYLYKPVLEHKEDIAIAYNNRCYAEMHLGLLHRALADCTASLRFGNLPDAYAKQQEIMRRLKARPVAPAEPLRSA